MAKAVKTKVVAPSKDADLVALMPPDMKALVRLISTIAEVGIKQRERISFAAPACVEHAIVQGNTTPLTELYKALGPDSRRNDAFVKWCLEFAPVRWIEGKDEGGGKALGSFGIDKKRTDEFKAKLAEDRIGYLSSLIKLPFWDFVKEPPVKPFSLIAIMEAAVSRAKKRRDNPEDDAKTPEDDFFGLEDAESFVAALKSKKTDAVAVATVH
jgi:hypothetical protein